MDQEEFKLKKSKVYQGSQNNLEKNSKEYKTLISIYLIISVFISIILGFLGLVGSGGKTSVFFLLANLLVSNILTMCCFNSDKFFKWVLISYVPIWYLLLR